MKRRSIRFWSPAAAGRLLLAAAVLFGLLGQVLAPPAHAGDPTQTKAVTTGPNPKTLDDSDPINMGTGEHFFLLDLLRLGGPLPLDFRLYYGSQVDSKRQHDGFPSRFAGNQRGTLTIDSNTRPRTAFVELGLGDEIGFDARGPIWEPHGVSATRYQLTQTASAFYLLDPVQSLVYTFVPTTTTVPLGAAVVGIASVSSSGALANGASRAPALSTDGRYVAFSSAAGNLVDGDTNAVEDVFVRDLQTRQTIRVSVSSTGVEGNGASLNPAISADGRYVAFDSAATNLTGGDTNGASDVFVRDRQTGQTTRVSVSSTGAEGNGASSNPAISSDGRYVAFESAATNLVEGDTNGQPDIFVRDLQAGQTTRVNLSSTGDQANGISRNPAISGDGRAVAFDSFASNLVTGDTNGFGDVFVRDRQTGQTSRVSVSSGGAAGNQDSALPALSSDGRYVAFESLASTLVSGDTNGFGDVFVHDRQTGQTTRVSVSSAGSQGNKGSSDAAISADGRYVAYQSAATNLVPLDLGNRLDIHVHDRTTGETARASQVDSFTWGSEDSTAPVLSADGRFVAFRSGATNWGLEDTNAVDDVFVAERAGPTSAFLVRVEDRNGNTLTYTNPANVDQAGPTRVEDGLGRTITLTYATVGVTDTRPYVTKIEDQGGRAWTLGYENSPVDNPGRVTLRSLADPLGNATTFRYAGAGTQDLLTSQTLPLGNVPYTQTYNARFTTRGVVAAQRDAYSNTTAITADAYGPYNDLQSRFTITAPDGTHQVYTTTHYGRVVERVTDQAGQTIRFESDTVDRVTAVTDRLGATTSITYHLASGRIGGITDALGNATAYTYTTRSQAFTNPDNGDRVTFDVYDLTGVRYRDGTSEAFSFDARGNLLTRTDRAGNVWTMTYNSRGQLLTLANPVGGVVTYTYNADGTVASLTDSDTGTTTFGYDGLKRPVTFTRPDGGRVQVGYDALDRVTTVTDENGRTTTYTYDANGNRTRVTDAAGNAVRYEYDLLDRVVRATDRLSQTVSTTYDSLGRRVAITDATGIGLQLGYDPRGWVERITQDGRTWRTEYDAEGVPVTRTTPLGRANRRQTDLLGQLTGVTDPLGNRWTLSRDAVGRPTRETDPLGRSTTDSYDGQGRLVGVTLPVSGTTAYQRDGLGRISRLTDLNGQRWDFTYTPMGRVRTATDPTGRTITTTYDTRGRPAGVTYPDAATVAESYDAVGNLTRLQYSDGTDLQFSYDALNRLVATTGLTLTYDAEGRVTSTADGTTSFGATYDAAGRLQTATYNNGAFTATYTYSPTTGLLMRVSDSLTGAQVDFAYDADFRLTGLTRSNGVATALSWDDASRLTRIRDGAILDLQYALDAAGQVTGVVMTAPLDPVSALPSGSSSLGYDAASQLSTGDYRSDARGRLVAGPGAAYTWDGASRLVATGGVTLTYNGAGGVRTRTATGSTTLFYYNAAIGNRLVAERDETSGQFQRYYVWTPDGRLLYGIDAAGGNRVFFYHFDRTGSTLALTDASGAVTDAYAYTPYGQVLGHTGSSPQPFTYAGQWGARQEGASGTLYQMQARYYDATTARFLSREPIWPNPGEPRQLNPYAYALGRPTSLVDVTGLDSQDTARALAATDLELAQQRWRLAQAESEYARVAPAAESADSVDTWAMATNPVNLYWYVGYSFYGLGNYLVTGEVYLSRPPVRFSSLQARAIELRGRAEDLHGQIHGAKWRIEQLERERAGLQEQLREELQEEWEAEQDAKKAWERRVARKEVVERELAEAYREFQRKQALQPKQADVQQHFGGKAAVTKSPVIPPQAEKPSTRRLTRDEAILLYGELAQFSNWDD